MCKYSLVIHGAFEGNWLEKIKRSIFAFKPKFSKIVIVSYEKDYSKYIELVQRLNFDNVQFVKIKDLINPGFFNINRQVLSVRTGLELIDDDDFVFKLRNDQVVDFNKVLEYKNDEKIITTNCYTRRDRLYHPSDMFLAAKAKLLKEYYSLPLSERTHLMVEMDNRQYYAENPNCSAIRYCPEIMLARHYLKIKKWDFKENEEDSFEALSKYFVLVNSWNINFRSHKKRSYNEKQNSIIIPHYFNVSPFEGVQPENVSCYMAHDFKKTMPSFMDVIFLIKAKIYWYFWSENQHGIKRKFKKLKLFSRKFRREMLKMLPYVLVHKKIDELNYKIKGMLDEYK